MEEDNKPWAIQRKLQSKRRPEKQYVIDRAVYAKGGSPRDACLVSLTYLTGGRISEIVAIKTGDIKEEQIEMKDGTKRKHLVIEMPNKKNRKRKFKTIPLSYIRDKALIDCATPWIEYRRTQLGLEQSNKTPSEWGEMDTRLFAFTPTRGYQIIREITEMNPHFLRHLRLTECALTGMQLPNLQKMAGWTDLKPAQAYMELNYYDIAQDW
jgi:integrase